MTDKENFEAELNKLGFKIIKSNNGLNDKIKTPNGKIMGWRVNEDGIEPYNNKLYGESNVCIVKFNYKTLHKIDEDCISLGDSGNFVLFMNHKI